MNEICLSCKKHTKCGRAKVETIGCGYYVPMTNEEYIHSLKTEQLAEFLRQIYKDGRDDYVGEWYEQTEEDFVEWLKQPHRGE